MLKAYRHIPIKAVQFTDKNKDMVFRTVCEIQANIYPAFSKDGEPILLIPTNDEELVCELGDYLTIIERTNPKDWRRISVIKEAEFLKNYEEVL